MRYFAGAFHRIQETVLPRLRNIKINFADLAIVLIGLAMAVLVRLPLLDFNAVF